MHEMVQTSHAFVMDDDHAITKTSKFSSAVASIPEAWQAEIVGFPLRQSRGVVLGGRRFVCKETNEGKIVAIQKSLKEPFHFVANNFLAPSQLLRDNPWPENLKMGEHFIWWGDLYIKSNVHVHCMPFCNSWNHMIRDSGRQHPSYRRFRRRPIKERQEELERRGIKQVVWGNFPLET
jgi:hypothetical protein